MTDVTIAEINTAIKDTLAVADGLVRSQNYNELSEGMNDYPTMQVYWNSGETDATNAVDRSSFGGGIKPPVRQADLQFYVDVYATQRSDLAEDNDKLTTMASNIWTVLDQQVNPPYGLSAIRAHHWTAQRVNFQYGDETYPGVRFIISVRVF